MKLFLKHCDKCGKKTPHRVIFSASYTMRVECTLCKVYTVANNENNFLVG